jgi:prepilin-type N-terminal cleavage/methylation domain-containing protein
MTLIEMMVVVLIVAVAATGLSVGFGALTRTHLRSACMRVAAGARYAFNRAISQGTTVRLAFDFGSHRMSFEEADGNVMLARVDDARRLDIEGGDEASDAAAVDPWAAARARLEDTLRPSFGAGVEIARLITPHEAEPREEGTGHIYFFASGQTEHAVVWVSDGGGRTFSVELHPLTGRARVREGAFEPEELILDGDEESSEVRE